MEQPKHPKRWKLAILVWIFIYPTINLLAFVLSPVMIGWPFIYRTLLLTLCLVPLMVFVALPFIQKRFAVWLRK